MLLYIQGYKTYILVSYTLFSNLTSRKTIRNICNYQNSLTTPQSANWPARLVSSIPRSLFVESCGDGFYKDVSFQLSCNALQLRSPSDSPPPTATEPANNKYLISPPPHPSLYQRRAHLAGNMRNYNLCFHLRGGGRGTQPFPGENENVVNLNKRFWIRTSALELNLLYFSSSSNNMLFSWRFIHMAKEIYSF